MEMWNDQRFRSQIGVFHIVWMTLELTIDIAIGKFGRLTPEVAHRETNGRTFKDRVKRLNVLLRKKGGSESARQILECLVYGSMRNIIAHSFVSSLENGVVVFVYRTQRKPTDAEKHCFTIDDFDQHIALLHSASVALSRHLNITDDDQVKFISAGVVDDASSRPRDVAKLQEAVSRAMATAPATIDARKSSG